MGIAGTLTLGLFFAVVGLTAASLQAWLWRFPLVPDPSGRNSDGVSSAPRGWTNVHRAFGYLFATLYVALAVVMVPRLWVYTAEPEEAVPFHLALGLLIGPVLAAKILVIRRFRRLGGRLPWFGGTLCASAVVAVALVAVPAARMLVRFEPDPDGRWAAASATVQARCLQCHGATRITFQDDDLRGWRKVAAEMQRRAARAPGKRAITDREVELAAQFLAAAFPERDHGGR